MKKDLVLLRKSRSLGLQGNKVFVKEDKLKIYNKRLTKRTEGPNQFKYG